MMSDRMLYSSDVLSDAMVELKRLSGSLEEIAGDLSHVDTSGDWWDTIRFSSGRANGTARVVLPFSSARACKRRRRKAWRP